MTEQSAIVTGGAKRVGKALAIGLAERGFDIGLHYHNSEKDAVETQKEIEKFGRKCVLLKCDLSDKKAVISLIEEANKKLANIKLLINSASIFKAVNFLQTDLGLLEQNFAVHVTAPFILMTQFAKICNEGNVINITDTLITRSETDYFAYLLSKKTLGELTKQAARALAPKIRVNALAPGSTVPPLGDFPANYMQMRAKEVPLQMLGSPEYLLKGIDYLLANPFVTGETLFIDGGAHIEY